MSKNYYGDTLPVKLPEWMDGVVVEREGDRWVFTFIWKKAFAVPDYSDPAHLSAEIEFQAYDVLEGAYEWFKDELRRLRSTRGQEPGESAVPCSE